MNGENQKVTNEELVQMIAVGSEETAKKAEMKQRFDAVEERLDRIEKILLQDHQLRIEKLEAEMREMKGLLAIK